VAHEVSVVRLKEMSNKYGKNAEYVLAGGGNTSYKDENYLYVKGSGVSLADIEEDGFVKLERSALKEIFVKTYSDNDDEREAAVLVDLLAAKCAGQEGKRPSVEALLHDVLPFSYVLHIHPGVVNGMTCGKEGKANFERLFGKNGIWIAPIMPGYILAATVKNEVGSYIKANGKPPLYVFLENHGVFIGGNDVPTIDKAVDEMNTILKSVLKRTPDFSSLEFDVDLAVSLAPAVRALTSGDNLGCAVFNTNKEIMNIVKDKASFESTMLTFSPDHMVYCYDKGLFVELFEDEDKYTTLAQSISIYVDENGKTPKIIGIKGLGYYACGATKKEADIAAAIFLDAVKVAVFSESFGGGKSLPETLIYAINNWEVERYRKSVSFKGGASKRLNGKITIITGSAQGFGKGIAEEMAKDGAYIGVADLNVEGANENANYLNATFGKGTAIGIKVNVGDEQDVKAMIDKMVLNYGGLDIFVSNAGILKSGSLEEMDLVWFERMTKVNYTAYFLCTKYASRIMKLQNRFVDDVYMDIIQINSKSGLAGSNKNFAYAGGKFGGIGLTQSFAMELVPYNIKVNAICPGNFFEGPLWNDPEKGLFVQYLRSGKVSGAKTIDDVKKAYEQKVPMGRGTYVKDVARAINYVVEQEYETGQAIPVTGGQEMLK
jgi:NAD(P)-dependent dehydrogenase (short-subunit alcohol dehydrogenase family)/rhamnose utilization protein RhaD (predicted bifunctional aldolase and dehydrogenase)